MTDAGINADPFPKFAETDASRVSPEPGCVAVFGHDLDDSTVIKRCRAFQAIGCRLISFTMRRGKVTRSFRPAWPNVHLGETTNGRYVRRILTLVGATLKLWRHRKGLLDGHVVYARNLDMLVLAQCFRVFSGAETCLVYECLDVHKLLSGNGRISSLLRWFERRLLNRCSLVVVSSSHFVSRYFRPVQRYRGATFLLENKLWFGAGPPARPICETPAILYAKTAAPRWVIGWFGVLRCRRTLDILERVAIQLGDRVGIYIRGRIAHDQLPDFEERVARVPNIVFEGPYRHPEDLGSIYARVDMMWAQDFYEAGANSDWLLPNRIYEGGYFGCPALALADSATGQKIAALASGWTLHEPLEDALPAFLVNLTREGYLAVRANLMALPRSTFVHEDKDFRELLDAIGPRIHVAGTARTGLEATSWRG